MSTTPYSAGTHFSDGVRSGPILGSKFTTAINPLTPSPMVSTPLDLQPPGIFNAPITAFNIIPAVGDPDSIFAVDQALPGYLALNLTPQHGVTILTYQGIPNVIKLDCARNIKIYGLGGDVEQSQFDIYGWDIYGVPMLERIGGPVGAGAVEGRKAFSYIRAIFSSADTVGNISIGVGNTFGLPYLLPHIQAVLAVLWENQPDDSLFIVGDQSKATSTTGDVRGTCEPTTDANNSNMLSIYFYNWSGDAQNYNLANSGQRMLGPEPLSSVMGQPTVTVFASNHQLTEGQPITISGATGFANLTPEQLNITASVDRIIDENYFEYISTGIANSTDSSGGGELVILSPERGNLYATTTGRFGVEQFYIDPV